MVAKCPATRFVIVGPSGSGETTLARLLGERFGLKPVSLDDLVHVPGSVWQKRPRPDMAGHDGATPDSTTTSADPETPR
jgi:ABC-type iron transport system FetAB ATPase subunit